MPYPHALWHSSYTHPTSNVISQIIDRWCIRTDQGRTPSLVEKIQHGCLICWAVNSISVLAAWSNCQKTSENFGHQCKMLIRLSPLIHRKIRNYFLFCAVASSNIRHLTSVYCIGQNLKISIRHFRALVNDAISQSGTYIQSVCSRTSICLSS